MPPRLSETTAEPLCVDLKEAARMLGVSIWTLRSWIDEGLIRTVKFPSSKHPGEISRRILISVDDLRDFVRQHRNGAAE
jgi:hypothetical protein